MDTHINGFIAYLNSLHNIGAGGANALAESQAMSPYFGEVYMPFPLIEQLVNALTDGVPKVVVLTGHAGDGKSTIALDVFKKLRNLPLESPLDSPLKEREDIEASEGSITIVKDMSELSTDLRQQWLGQAFSEPGSWLVVSNTGPLLKSLGEYSSKRGFTQDIESEILEVLDKHLESSSLEGHCLDIFDKQLVIINLTRIDNVGLGAQILTKLVNHSAWQMCEGCDAKPSCPLQLNRNTLLEAEPVPEERVRWLYQRLSAYDHRLTLRQIVAQLAFSMTGGMTCLEAQERANASKTDHEAQGGSGLDTILFSEGFFGYRGGKPWPEAEGLLAVSLMRRATLSSPVGVDYEHGLLSEHGMAWSNLPGSLDFIRSRWRKNAIESAGVRWRFALRRMAYFYGNISEGHQRDADIFLDTFLESPSLREFDKWQSAGHIALPSSDIKRLCTSCLKVLLEIYSGFSSSQFHNRNDSLYLTLRRPDLAVFQPTQLVIATLSFRNFDLKFDKGERVPVLKYEDGSATLPLTLPLLDYIRRRDTGELGSALSPIHQAQLDLFQAKLLEVAEAGRRHSDEIELLRAGIDGEVHTHRFLLNQDQNMMEQC